MRHIVGISDVIQAIMISIGNKAAIGKAFPIAGPSAFTYDILSEYIAKKLDIPVLRFKVPGFHDFRHNISFSRSVLGYNPTYDIFKIVDEAVDFRRAGKQRTETKYIG
jgi:nucleoside-diphosphate-sugar epimerase